MQVEISVLLLGTYIPKMPLRFIVAKDSRLLLATPITRFVRVCYAFGRCRVFKVKTAGMIAECAPSFHPMASQRILYVGHDLTLLKTLTEALEDCQMVRCPGGTLAHTLIESEIGYSLFLLDEELPDTIGRELARFARRIRHRKHTPIIILSASNARCAGADMILEKPDNLKALLSAIKHLLAAPQ
jgi:CheY-like chemotaxis protein